MSGRELPVLRGERVVLRPVRDGDHAPLLAMLAEPDVARWFGSWDAARVRRDLLAPQDDEVVLAIEVDGAVAGVLMVGEEEDARLPLRLDRHRARRRAPGPRASGRRRCGS